MTSVEEKVNWQIGRRLLLARRARGLTQPQVGNMIGVSFQQIQKYERGANAIAPGKLTVLARELGCPVSYFFDEIKDSGRDTEPMSARAVKVWRGIQTVERQHPAVFTAISRMVAAITESHE